MIGHVGIIHVGPEANLTGEILPHALVFPYALLTLLDEGSDAVFLDLLLAVQTKRLFHLQLHRKSVGVPARFSGNHIALHGAVSGDHVLDCAGLHMADMGLAVCGRRSVIKGIGRTAFSDLQALLKNLVLFPEFLDFLFPAHKIQVGVHFFIKRHLLPSFLHDRYLLHMQADCSVPSVLPQCDPSAFLYDREGTSPSYKKAPSCKRTRLRSLYHPLHHTSVPSGRRLPEISDYMASRNGGIPAPPT